MADAEQLKAWQRLKKHLSQTQILMLTIKDDADLEIRIEADKIVEQIDHDINVVEELFILAE